MAIAVQAQCRLRAESVEGAQWVQAGSLVPGDVVFWLGDEEGKSDSTGRQPEGRPPLGPPADGGRAEPGRVGVGVLPLHAIHIDDAQTEWSEEEVYDLEVEGAHSFVTEVCAVHNCGSGTTAHVPEQWGRRWITIDVSRVPLAPLVFSRSV